jgi:hypothetical protein
MLDPHISALIRDYGRSLLYRRPRPNKAKAPFSRAFDKGVSAARMGMDKDDNPYLAGTHAYGDWNAGFDSSIEADKAMDLD